MNDLPHKLIRAMSKIDALLTYINSHKKFKPEDIDVFSSTYLDLLMYVRKIGQDINAIRVDLKREKIAWLDVLDKELAKEKKDAQGLGSSNQE